MKHNLAPSHDDAADFEPLTAAIDRVAAGIARTVADQSRPGSDYLRNPPLTTREREWAARARLAARLLEVLANADSDDMLSPSLDPALIALRAILADVDRAPSPRC